MTSAFHGLLVVSVVLCGMGLGASFGLRFFSLFLAMGASLLLLLTQSLRRAAERMRALDEGAVSLQRVTTTRRHFTGVPIRIRAVISTRRTFRTALVRVAPRQSRHFRGTGDLSWVVALSEQQPIEIEYELVATTSGTIKLPPLTLTFLDEWGLCAQERDVNDRLEITVWPIGMKPMLTRRHRVPTSMRQAMGLHQVRRAGIGSEMHELRPFQANDSSRKISWPATARRGRLMVREVEAESPVPVMVVLNADESMRSGPIGTTPFDQATNLLLALIEASNRVRDPIGACICDGHGSPFGRRYLKPSVSRLSRYRILNALLACRAGMPAPAAVDTELFHESMVAHFRKTVWSGAGAFAGRRALLRAGLAKCRTYASAAGDDESVLREYAWSHALPMPVRHHDVGRDELRQERAGRGIDGVAEALRFVLARTTANTLFVVITTLPKDATGIHALLPQFRRLRAEHHQAILVSPAETASPADRNAAPRRLWALDEQGPVSAEFILACREMAWMRVARAATSRLGVPILSIDARDIVTKVLMSVNRLRREVGASRW